MTEETVAKGTADEATTTYEYNEEGKMTSLTDPVLNETTWDYDEVGREIEMTDPLDETVTKTYDDDGRLASILSRNNLLREFEYDADGRLETETWYDGPTDQDTVVDTYEWEYNEDGQLTSAGNDTGDYTFVYDHTGQLIEVDNPYGVTLYFGYDDRGYRVSVSDSEGGLVESEYDDAGQLLSRVYTADSEPDLRIDFEYDDYGQVTKQTRYSDAAGTTLVGTSEWSYDDEGRLESLEHDDSSAQSIADYLWDWDAMEQLTSQTDHGSTREYDYDEQGQVVSEDIDESLTEWEYDENGNRDSTGYTVGTGNRITSDGTWDYTYDDEGNLTEKDEISGDLRWMYGYDHANQLIEVKSYDGQTKLDHVVFTYDVFGNRIEKEVNPAQVGPSELIERYVYDDWNLEKPTPIGNENWDVWADITDMGVVTTRYLRGDVVDELFARLEDGTDAFWYLRDHLGSIRDIVDDGGDLVKSVEYDAWGNIISESGTGELGRYAWTGREFDTETELQYNRARFYDPALGRWMTQDPLGFGAGDGNLYRYIHNTSTTATDPSGLFGNSGVQYKNIEVVKRTPANEKLKGNTKIKIQDGNNLIVGSVKVYKDVTVPSQILIAFVAEFRLY